MSNLGTGFLWLSGIFIWILAAVATHLGKLSNQSTWGYTVSVALILIGTVFSLSSRRGQTRNLLGLILEGLAVITAFLVAATVTSNESMWIMLLQLLGPILIVIVPIKLLTNPHNS